MVDFNKISEAVQKTVKEIAKTEGSKKRIDTKRECMQLSHFLAGNYQNMNVHEKDYVAGLVIEYQEKAFEEQVTNSTKDLVKDIAKRTYDKKKIDSDEEALALATLLRNTRGELNKADLEYIKQVLIKNGYGEYIEMFNQQQGRTTEKECCPTRPEPQEPTKAPEDSTSEKTPNTTDTPKEPIGQPQEDKQAPVEKTPKEKPVEKSDTPTPKSEPTTEEEVAPQKPTKFDKAVISEKGRTEGMVIAQKILDEFNSMVVDNDKIKEYIGEINSENAFTVLTAVKKGIEKGVNEKTLIDTKDPFNKLTMSESYDIGQALLKQAAGMGLGFTKEYKALDEEIKRIDIILDHKSNADPSKNEAIRIDKTISALLKAMNDAVYQTDRNGSYESRDENSLVKLKFPAELIKKLGKNNEKQTKND